MSAGSQGSSVVLVVGLDVVVFALVVELVDSYFGGLEKLLF